MRFQLIQQFVYGNNIISMLREVTRLAQGHTPTVVEATSGSSITFYYFIRVLALNTAP